MGATDALDVGLDRSGRMALIPPVQMAALAMLGKDDPLSTSYLLTSLNLLLENNQTLTRMVADVQRGMDFLRQEVAEMRAEMKAEKAAASPRGERTNHEQNNEGLAFSVYLRQKEEQPRKEGQEGNQGEKREDAEQEVDVTGIEEKDGVRDTKDASWLLATETLRSLGIQSINMDRSVFSSGPPPSAPQEGVPSTSQVTDDQQRNRRIVLPCPHANCEVILYSELGFSAHLRVHDGRMPFECSSCGREFRLRDGYVKHLRTHTGERPYTCNLCGMNFKRVHHRKKHVQAKHVGSNDSLSV